MASQILLGTGVFVRWLSSHILNDFNIGVDFSTRKSNLSCEDKLPSRTSFSILYNALKNLTASFASPLVVLEILIISANFLRACAMQPTLTMSLSLFAKL